VENFSITNKLVHIPKYLESAANQNVFVIKLNLSLIAHLDEKEFFRLLSLQIAGQVAKWPCIEHTLNLPVPDNPRNFCRFLGQVAAMNQELIMLIPHGWENLPEPRKQKFYDFFTIVRQRGRIPRYKKKFFVQW